jgi:prepilin-type N-terminal cleavage/methylation domain-containing protein
MEKEARKMICTAQMQTKERETMDDGRGTRDGSSIFNHPASIGFTLTEMLIVMVILSMFVLLVQLNLFGALEKSKSRMQIQKLVSTMQMAAGAAGQSDRRYEVIIDLDENSFLLREITTPDLSVVLDEEVISKDYLGENYRFHFVKFDDGDSTYQGKAKFRAGRWGWAYGGKIVLQDEKENFYSIVVNRLNRMVTFEDGDVEVLEPKTKNEIVF